MRKSFKPAILAAVVAAAVASPAFAEGDGGDNSMSPWYGDSWSNVQSHAPEVTAVPALQAHEELAPAREAWGHTRDNMRARTQHMREATSNTLHRMTGTTTTTDDRAVGTAAGGTVSSGTAADNAPGAYSNGTMSNDTTRRSTTSTSAAPSAGTADTLGKRTPGYGSVTGAGYAGGAGAAANSESTIRNGDSSQQSSGNANSNTMPSGR